MKIRDGPDVDVLMIRFNAPPGFESDKAKPGVNFDASKRADNPHIGELVPAA